MTADSDPHLVQLLIKCAHRARVELDAELEFDEMSPMELIAIRIMTRTPGNLVMVDLAGKLKCTVANAAQLVERLVRDGYLERVTNAADQREKPLLLTERAKRSAELAEDALDRVAASFTRSFTSQEKAMLYTLLDRLAGGADQHLRERIWARRGAPARLRSNGRDGGRIRCRVRDENVLVNVR